GPLRRRHRRRARRGRQHGEGPPPPGADRPRRGLDRSGGGLMEPDLLDALDRRAAAAVAALDDAVAEIPVPAPPPEPEVRRARRWMPLLVAAALVVVALVAAGLLLDRDGGEQGTVAGEPEVPTSPGHTQLAFPDPDALGYRIVGAFPAVDGDGTGTFESAAIA